MEKKGSAMYFALIVLTIILGIVLGLSTMLISQIRIVRGMEHSVIAFHSANSGIERALRILRPPPGTLPPTLPHTATGSVMISGAGHTASYSIRIEGHSAGCPHAHFCIRSVGYYRGVRRAIEAGG